MTGPKTNERPGVRAQHRHARMSATKARVVLDLIRGKSVAEARTILQFSERGAADAIIKVLDSAVANAANNNDIPPEELFVATAYADEGPTLKRWRPRARGRATRIRKRTCHITVIVSRYSDDQLAEIRRQIGLRYRQIGSRHVLIALGFLGALGLGMGLLHRALDLGHRRSLAFPVAAP